MGGLERRGVRVMTGAPWGGGEEAGVERQAQSSGAKVPSPTRVAGCLSPLSSGSGPSGTLVLVLRPRVPCDSVWLSPGIGPFASSLSPGLSPRRGLARSSCQAAPRCRQPRRPSAAQRGRGVGQRGVAARPHSAPCPQERPVASSWACGVRTRDVGRGDKVSVNQEEQVRTVYGAVSFSMGLL